MSLEAAQIEDVKKESLEGEVFSTEKDEIEAGQTVDRLKAELNIDVQKNVEIKREKDVKDIRAGLGLEKEEGQEILVEVDAFLKKMAIPFDDKEVDVKRQKLLNETHDKISPYLNSLNENKNKSLAIKKEIEGLTVKIQNLELQKAEKEEKLVAMRNEAQEYINKTKWPILRSDTKEKLAKAKSIVAYCIEAESGYYTLDPSNEAYKIYNEMGSLKQEASSFDASKLGKNAELDETKKDSLSIQSIIKFNLTEKNSKFEELEQAQKVADKYNEVTNFSKDVLKNLYTEIPESAVEINPLIQEKQRLANENSNKNIIGPIRGFFNQCSYKGLTSEQGLDILKLEVKKVRESANITINMGTDSLVKMLDDGKLKSIFEISEKQKAENVNNVRNYIPERIKTEKAVGVYAKGTEEDPYAIVGAMASANGYQEICGGARYYGSIFIKMKSSVLDRCVYYNGDSMGTTSGDVTKSKKEDALGFLYNKNDAVILKAIRDMRDKESSEIAGREFDPGNHLNGYLEADIIGGVKIEDVASINIPVAFEEKAKELREKYPQYADLIKEV